MLKAENIAYNQVNINGKWVAAKPEPQPFVLRAKDAWAVLTGKAEAVSFKGQK